MQSSSEKVSIDNNFQLAEWEVRPASNEIVSKSETRRLDHKVMRLLLYLVQHTGEELSKDQLLKGVWGEGVHNEEVLTVAVSALRKALGDDARSPRFIRTIPRVGYHMIHDFDALQEQQSKSMWKKLEDRIGLRFLIIATLVALFLLTVLTQILIEMVFYLTRG